MAEKYLSYSEYKDSGVEWLGEIPKDWEMSRIKYSTTLNMGQSPNSEDCNLDGYGYPFLQGNAEFGKISPTAKQYCPVPRKLANKGDLLFSVRAPVGALNIADATYGIGRGLCSLASNSQMTQSFLWWVLPSYKYQLDAISTGSTFEAVSAEQVSNLLFALPSYEEQIEVANFLDHETSQIDTLIEKQQTLIKLLKEKRQAVISHAVTKGLNSYVPMKDSGVEWLGEVPEHWEVGRLKNVLRIRNGRDYKAVEVESGGYPVYGSGGIFKRSSDYLFNGESVLFGRKGTIDKPLLVSGKFWTVDTMFYSEVFDNAKPDYIYHQALLFPFDKLSTNTALPSMTQEDLLELGFVIPPFDEQEKICHYLNEKLTVFSNLVSKAEKAIQLMQERRTALISAAVTGKIDVRGWQAPDVKDL